MLNSRNLSVSIIPFDRFYSNLFPLLLNLGPDHSAAAVIADGEAYRYRVRKAFQIRAFSLRRELEGAGAKGLDRGPSFRT